MVSRVVLRLFSQKKARARFHLLLLLLFLPACARSQAEQMQAQINTVQEQSTPDKLTRRAQAYLRLGDWTRAEQYFVRALESGGDEEEIMPLLVQSCVQDQKYRAAAFYVEDYLRKRPNNVQMRFVLASLRNGLGETELARQELERVVARDPNHAEAHFSLAVLYRDFLGDFFFADRYFRRYLQLSPTGRHAEEAAASLLTELP